ncbi:DUF6958 family protein [Limimaricola litoreus]|uniref:DUF6958 family protein n=1 Tax=Limimaricola litoreus TaxID=2955316 RepID=UPI003F822A84
MIEISSATSADRTERVDRAKYTAMRDALLPVLPDTLPGMTVAEAKAALLEHLSQEHILGARRPEGGSKPWPIGQPVAQPFQVSRANRRPNATSNSPLAPSMARLTVRRRSRLRA